MELQMRNKFEFVDGTINKHCHTLVLSWLNLNHSMSREIATNMISIDGASEVWFDLKKIFSKVTDNISNSC